jgi:cyclic pyranopterin phosphate synthase
VKDSYGREMTNLRISITQRCDLRCLYCHREGEAAPGEEMTPDRKSVV